MNSTVLLRTACVIHLDTNPGFQPFGFAGGLYDHETGLVGRTHSDEEVWQRIEDRFGPLEEPTTP
ncbi:MAG: hypothetical protein D6761_04145 [Candidatus Dadabacteria bacterium]|nr:MAG: hypothetical protein D6761_04145 [Candidatus Dadabacteria bacterium]